MLYYASAILSRYVNSNFMMLIVLCLNCVVLFVLHLLFCFASKSCVILPVTILYCMLLILHFLCHICSTASMLFCVYSTTFDVVLC